MELEIKFGGTDVWSALSAIGTVGAVVVALGLAITERLARARERWDQSLSNVRLAERLSLNVHLFLEDCAKAAGDDQRLTSHQSRILLKSGRAQELIAGFSELRPADMPQHLPR